MGVYKLKGQKSPVTIYLKPSDRATRDLIEHLKSQSIGDDNSGEDAA